MGRTGSILINDMDQLTQFQAELADIAAKHGMAIIEEMGLTGPMYRVLSQNDLRPYLKLVWGYSPERLH